MPLRPVLAGSYASWQYARQIVTSKAMISVIYYEDIE